MTRQVAIYVFPNVEVLDFAGPFEVFTTASRVCQRCDPAQPVPFEVYTVARSMGPVSTRAGLKILPDYTLLDCPIPQILVIPGGVVDEELFSPELLDWIVGTSKSAELIASVCTGAFILAKSGLLARRTATTHWEDIDDLRRMFPDVTVVGDKRWVDEGRIVSSAGIAAGMDMSLHVVSRFAGEALARATAHQMDVPYPSEA
ncbi:MAG: DJ-1/PfpI family protein [Candidatus Contendobacter sp.]|nr:DJ-1/PfpI family protein [Candidatus Contendobacter sp.]